jgi:hypothetical protein
MRGQTAMLIDNDRLSHWLATGVVVWTCYVFFLGIPIFHFGLGVSTKKVILFAIGSCLLQLAVTPWMFWARATQSDPDRRFGHRIGAAVMWIGLTGILLLCFLQYGKAIDQAHVSERFFIIGGTAIAFGTVALTIGVQAGRRLLWSKRRRGLSED